jgi:hypothetical protein
VFGATSILRVWVTALDIEQNRQKYARYWGSGKKTHLVALIAWKSWDWKTNRRMIGKM